LTCRLDRRLANRSIGSCLLANVLGKFRFRIHPMVSFPTCLLLRLPATGRLLSSMLVRLWAKDHLLTQQLLLGRRFLASIPPSRLASLQGSILNRLRTRLLVRVLSKCRLLASL